MQGIADILGKKNFDVPPEVAAIKAYVQRHYNTDVSVTVLTREFVVSAPSAGLIGSLRLNVTALQNAAGTDKRISFRIG